MSHKHKPNTTSKLVLGKKPLFLLAGGGSGGPVVPLLAIAEEIRKLEPRAHFLLVGTKKGPEEQFAARANIPFAAVTAGKLRRYFSVRNLFSPFQVIAGFAQALRLVRAARPAAAIGAGGFVQVPVLYAAKLMGVPVIIHQQDALASFANTLCSPIASKITVSFEGSLKSFFQGSGLLPRHSPQKVVFTGNPFREELKEADKEEAAKYFHLLKDWPTLLVLGGGTGARFINRAVEENLYELCKVAQVIHVTGKGKMGEAKHPNYHPYEFMPRMDLAYAASDIVITRAGLSTLTELSNLGKVTLIIPMPKTHQEANAQIFWEHKAAIVLDQTTLDTYKLPALIKKILFKPELQKNLTGNIKKIMPKGAGRKIAEIVLKEAGML